MLYNKDWNPFIREKLFAQTYRWRLIKEGNKLPVPSLAEIDPTNLCDFNCLWCNSKTVRNTRKRSLSRKTLLSLADFFSWWVSEFGVEAVSVAGGGEPLLNSDTGEFIYKVVENGLKVGVITNGLHIDNFIDSLAKCIYISVSMDAASPETHHKLKRTPNIAIFSKIINNIVHLIDYSKTHNTLLGSSLPAYGITYKYLLYPGNIGEVYQAAVLAKQLGCKNICYRPAITPSCKLGSKIEIKFFSDDIALYNEQILVAKELNDNNFNVYDYIYRVGPTFESSNLFEKCYSTLMTAIFQPSMNDSPEDSFTLGLCCSHRGDERFELLHEVTDVKEIIEAWGNLNHWKIHNQIDHKTQCSQCTHVAHNQVYEQVILKDSLTYEFV